MNVAQKFTLVAIISFFLLAGDFTGYAENNRNTEKLPHGFINIKHVIPTIQVAVRYYTRNNFVGRRISGYQAPICLLTKQAATALKEVQNKLIPMRLSLKAYDCYRPQKAVNDFIHWAKDYNETQMKTEYYPKVNKQDLFKKGYIAYRSGHSRGSTVDLTIVPLYSDIPIYNPKREQIACTAPKILRSPDNSLDFGTGFDCFSPVSHPNYENLSPQIKANKLLLRTLMIDAGFRPLNTEWWHFTLQKEPYPNTYFNFPVREYSK